MDIDPLAGVQPNVETNKLFQMVSEVVSVVGFVVSLLALVTGGSSAILSALFMSTVAVRHVTETIRAVCPKFEIEAGIMDRVRSCHHAYHLATVILFAMTGICPLLYIVVYVISFARSCISVVCDRVPLGEYEKLCRQVMRALSSSSIQIAEICIELLLKIELIYDVWSDCRFGTLLALFGYIFLFMMSELANKESNSWFWDSVLIGLREIAAKNAETFGPQLEKFVDTIDDWRTELARLFPGKELKVHLH